MDMFVTENFGSGQPQEPHFSQLKKCRQEIVSIEYVLDTVRPSIFSAGVLEEFSMTITEAIDAIRHSNDELGEFKKYVLRDLRLARDHTELAKEEIRTRAKSNKKRYEFIGTARENLELVIENLGGKLFQKSSYPQLKKYRQEIVNIEQVLDTMIPSMVTADLLEEFSMTITEAIDEIRNSNNELSEFKKYVLRDLRLARNHTELARDEILANVKNHQKRYEFIRASREGLETALRTW